MMVEWSDGRYGVFRATTPLYLLEMKVEYRGEKGGFVALVNGGGGLVIRSDKIFASPEKAKEEAQRLAVYVLKRELALMGQEEGDGEVE